MFAFMWNMTHSVPAIAMATNTTVKMVDSMVQPPSILPFMCRKYTMCTTICTTANAPSTSTAVLRSAITLAMTSQNGMAVRMVDRMKPVMYPDSVLCGPSSWWSSCPPWPWAAWVVCCALIYSTPIRYTKVKTPIQTTSRKCQNIDRHMRRRLFSGVRPSCLI